jgi:hypothetical protein
LSLSIINLCAKNENFKQNFMANLKKLPKKAKEKAKKAFHEPELQKQSHIL